MARPAPAKFSVIMAPRVLRDLSAIHGFIVERSPAGADAMLDRIGATIASLAHMPKRFGRAVEGRGGRGGRGGRRELRQAVAGPYRVVFEVVGDEVWVFTVRHAGRRPAMIRRARPG